MNDILIYTVAVFFLLMGLVGLARPKNITDNFYVPEITSDMRNEIRAVYGGFGVAIFGLLIASTRIDSLRDGILVTVAVSVLGMAAGRIISFIIERPKGPYPYIYFVAEIMIGAMLLSAYRPGVTI